MNQDLTNKEAVEKLRQIAKGIGFATLATALSDLPIHMVPMNTKKVDEDGRIWFLSGSNSQHNQNIKLHSEVHLIYSNAGSMQFLNVFGSAAITTDIASLRELYSKTDDAWFGGVDDPNLTAICVTPKNVYYWEPKSNKIVMLLKLGVAAARGRKPDLLNQGELKIEA